MCSLSCCGVRNVTMGDELADRAMEYVAGRRHVARTAKFALLTQVAIVGLCVIAAFYFGLMGLALQDGQHNELAVCSGVIAAAHAMLAGALLSGAPRLHTIVTMFPAAAIGGITMGIVFAGRAQWKSVDPTGGFVVCSTTFAITTIWLAVISAGIGWGVNASENGRAPPPTPNAYEEITEEAPLIQ
jgi:hypothetical protein